MRVALQEGSGNGCVDHAGDTLGKVVGLVIASPDEASVVERDREYEVDRRKDSALVEFIAHQFAKLPA